MTASFSDLVAGKILVQLGWRSGAEVATDLSQLDRDFSARNYLEQLARRGALDEPRRARVARWVARYERVRREALYAGLLERSSLISGDELERWKARLDAEGYARALSTMLREAGRIDAETDRRLLEQQVMGLERESDRLLASYRRTGFEGVTRPITKDPRARIETGIFTIKGCFRSQESQRLARASMLLAESEGRPPIKPLAEPMTPGHDPATMRYQKFAYDQTAQFDAEVARQAIAREQAEHAGTVLEEGPGAGSGLESMPQRIGDLIIEGILGAGGMGVVLRARREVTGEPFAVKVARSRQREVVERFRREALATSLIRHENVVRSFGSGALPDGTPYMILELIPGRELREVLRERQVLPPREAISIVTQLLAALGAAHSEGVLHRDVKPENVLVAESGGTFAAKLMDFGLARIERDVIDEEAVFRTISTDAVSGSPPYLAPEQIMGGAIDARTDLYATGVVLFEMLTGSMPFAAKSLSGWVRAHVGKPAPRLSEVKVGVPYPEPLEKFVASLLAKEPAQRPANVRAALDVIESEIVPALAPTAAEFAATQMDGQSTIALPARETRGITKLLARLWGKNPPPPPDRRGSGR